MVRASSMVLTCSIACVACGGDDDGTSGVDSGVVSIDAGVVVRDGGGTDGAAPGRDGGDGSDDDAGSCDTALDPSAIGATCTGSADCPDGYTCQPFVGFALTMSCQILCAGADDCNCPTGTSCKPTEDKSGSWFQCTPK